MLKTPRVLPPLLLIFCLALGKHTAAQAGPISFTSEANAINGTVTCADGSVVSILPVDATFTITTGSSNKSLDFASASACGMNVYLVTSMDDKTDDSDTMTEDDGDSFASTGSGSLLGGLVTWSSGQDADSCTESTPNTANFTASASATNMVINGQPLPPGDYPSGTQIPIVQASITVPSSTCTGVALFSGTLTLMPMSITGQNTNSVRLALAFLTLSGDLTCIGIPLGRIHYALTVGDPDIVANGTGNIELIQAPSTPKPVFQAF
ncbi:MAG TPA: hypothetical protein VKZ53_16975 [Candidatus Angelobacter sp.]|nr:hypothetical protein [Candidatus Angelobacter sp.]